MATPDDVLASIEHHRLSATIQKTNALRTALQHREPRCRICRDEVVRLQVDKLLDWVGVPIPLGPGKFHVVTYADADLVVLSDNLVADPRILRDLHSQGVAHLSVRVRDGIGLVGPLVIPGVTSCLGSH